MRRILYAALAGAATVFAACNADRLTVPQFNNPTPESVAEDPSAIDFAARGILIQNRGTYADFISDVGIFGRESFDYFPTDARSHTHYVAQNPLDPAGFASGGWTLRYRNLRNIHTFLQVVDGSATLDDEEKEAARGFAKTFGALELYYLITTRHNFGIVVQINDDPNEVAAFVSRDSAWNYIAARLDEAAAHLEAGGESFPFALTEGFTEFGAFDSPAGFLEFNRALKARVDVTRGSLRNPACGANGVTCYQSALAALSESFISLSAGDLNNGVYHVYSSEPGDALNDLNELVYKDFLAHPSITTDAQPGDQRVARKIRTLESPRGPSGEDVGIETPVGFKIYPSPTSPAPIIRNEELILLRAEARWFTGDKSGAIQDLNFVRQASGGLGPSSATTSSSDEQFITALLYERRMSLLWEGHRWADVRRFNRLNTLPLDLTDHFRQLQQPIPQGECDFRRGMSGDLACPTGPTGP